MTPGQNAHPIIQNGRTKIMTKFADIARQGRANALARLGGSPAGTGNRSRSAGAASVISFSSVRGRA
jgi:hypothetical protein